MDVAVRSVQLRLSFLFVVRPAGWITWGRTGAGGSVAQTLREIFPLWKWRIDSIRQLRPHLNASHVKLQVMAKNKRIQQTGRITEQQEAGGREVGEGCATLTTRSPYLSNLAVSLFLSAGQCCPFSNSELWMRRRRCRHAGRK